MKNYIFLILAIVPFSLFGQVSDQDEHSGVYVNLQAEFVFHHKTFFMYNLGGSPISYDDNDSRSQENNYFVIAGWYDIQRKFSVGLGFGLSNNPSFAADAIPIIIEGRYFLFPQENSPFLLFQMGRARPVYPDNGFYLVDPSNNNYYRLNGMRRGYLMNIGLGHKVKFFKRLSATVSASYAIKRYSHSKERYSQSENYLKLDGLSVSIGLFIK